MAETTRFTQADWKSWHTLEARVYEHVASQCQDMGVDLAPNQVAAIYEMVRDEFARQLRKPRPIPTVPLGRDSR